MNTHADRTKENRTQSISNDLSNRQGGNASTFQFVDNRPVALAQQKLKEMVDVSPQSKQAAKLQFMAGYYSAQQQPIQKPENNRGLPDNLKAGMENLSGMALDDVTVHRDSDKPALVRARAYAQGTDIHLASGQEMHLPHEAWHVVQQKQGRVRANTQVKGNVNINDGAGLEKEADMMASRVLSGDTLSPTQRKVAEPSIQPMDRSIAQLRKLSPRQESELMKLELEVTDAVLTYKLLRRRIMKIVSSPYNMNLKNEKGGNLKEELYWLPEFDTFFRKLSMIPERAEGSQASFKRLKRQLYLLEKTIWPELYQAMSKLIDTHEQRKGDDDTLIAEERDDLTQITEADERYFQWYMQQSRPVKMVYRGDGRNIGKTYLEDFSFTHIRAGGTRDVSFFGVIQHTHSSANKNGMVSTTTDREQAYHWAIDNHNFGVVYELQVNNYIDVAELLAARNFRNRFAAQLEILIPGSVAAEEVRTVVLYSKNSEIERAKNN